MQPHALGRGPARAAAGALALIAVATPAHAEKLLGRDETTIHLGLLLQPQAVVAQGGAPDGGPGTDFFLRRARVMLYGDLTERVGFFLETEQLNLGKDGNWDTAAYLQDAYLSLRVSPSAAPAVFIDAGMILVPFTRHALQSAISLNGLDYHTKLVLYPNQSTRVWRDVGVGARADLGRVQLRAGVYNGVEGVTGADPTMARNADDLPRLAGHARVSLLGRDRGVFYPGLLFTATPVVSVGVGADWQRGAIAAMAGPDDHLALAADAYAHLPTGADQAIVAQATVVRYDDGAAAPSTGYGGFLEAGFRVGRFEPVVAYEHFAADVPAGDLRAIHLGGAWFVDQHRTNLKLDVTRARTGTAANTWSATVQAQLSL
jgi:hypothetical protein